MSYTPAGEITDGLDSITEQSEQQTAIQEGQKIEQKRINNILAEILKEQKLTNKLLKKIYNPE